MPNFWGLALLLAMGMQTPSQGVTVLDTGLTGTMLNVSSWQPTDFVIVGVDDRELVRIHLPSGTVTFGPTYTPDAAAESFWRAIAQESPVALRKHIEELERKVAERGKP